jgi:phosphatidylethanolamine-binding protein
MHFSATLLLASAGAALAASNAQPADVAGAIGQAIAQFQGKLPLLAPLSPLSPLLAAHTAPLFHSGAQLIPTPVKTEWLEPVAALDVAFGNGTVPLGSAQQVSDLQQRPTYTLNYTASSAVSAVLTNSTRYTVMFIDASYYGDNSTGGNVTRHQLSNNYTLNAQTGLLEKGAPVTRYGAPLPASGDGPHRYLQLVVTQPEDFTAPAEPAQGSGVESWDVDAYWTAAKLGKIVAMNYISVQVGRGTKAESTSTAASSVIASASNSAAAAFGVVSCRLAHS